MQLNLSRSGAGRDGKVPHRYEPTATKLSQHEKAVELEQELGWKQELFAPESSYERKGRLKRELSRRNLHLWLAEGWAEVWKQELRGTLPSFGRKLH